MNLRILYRLFINLKILEKFTPFFRFLAKELILKKTQDKCYHGGDKLKQVYYSAFGKILEVCQEFRTGSKMAPLSKNSIFLVRFVNYLNSFGET